MKIGHHTWTFSNLPTIISSGVVGGPFEAQGNIANDFDLLHDNTWLKQDSFEMAQQKMMEEANDIALKKATLDKSQIDYFISGDLTYQITPTTFAAKTVDTPFLGLFSACATSTQSLALSAFIVNYDGAKYILSGSSSHHSAAERQFRYPTEYGGQKPPTAQWTATGAGSVIISKSGNGQVITTATVGKVVDMGLSDPFNMGGAMAPAAVDTIIQHLKDRNVAPSYYDLIITGDLGKIGREASFDLLKERGIFLNENQYVDCGLTLYKDSQPVQAGASGAACSAIVTYGHFLNQMKLGKLNKILFVATGSLHSPLTIQQKQTIPCIAHAVSIENRGDHR